MVNEDYSNILDDFEKRHKEEDEIHYYHDVLRHKMIIKQLKLTKKDIVLDAGCGTGDLLTKLAETGANVFGVDVSKPNIEHAKELVEKNKLKKVKLYVGDLKKLPFADDTFDKIVCTEVLEHLKNVDPALKELKRVCKKNGMVVITVPNLFHPWNFVPFELFPYKKGRLPIWLFPQSLFKGFLNQGYLTRAGEKMDIHYWFSPFYFCKKVSKYLKVAKLQSTLKWNNRIIYGIFPKLQEKIAKSWFGSTNFFFMKYFGIQLFLVAINK